jgi:hypothetical protein
MLKETGIKVFTETAKIKPLKKGIRPHGKKGIRPNRETGIIPLRKARVWLLRETGFRSLREAECRPTWETGIKLYLGRPELDHLGKRI